QVAEPNSKPRFIPGLFIACGLSPGTTSQVIRFAHPLRGRAKARSAKAVESRSRSQIQSLGSYRGISLPAVLSPGLRPRLFASLTPLGAQLKRALRTQSSAGRGAKFKASVHTGAFHRLLDSHQDYVPCYSLRSPLGAALKRVLLKQSSPGRGAKFKASVH